MSTLKRVLHRVASRIATTEDIGEIVQQAIENTDPSYLEKTLGTRNPGPNAAGSTFKTKQSVESLKSANWETLKEGASAISSPAIAYQADIPGLLGIVPIESISGGLDAAIQPAHAGKGIDRETGKLMAELVAVLPSKALEVDTTTIILGPSREDPKKLQVWTFHPGPPAPQGKPVFHEEVKAQFDAPGEAIPVKISEAKKMGFKFVKNIPELPET